MKFKFRRSSHKGHHKRDLIKRSLKIRGVNTLSVKRERGLVPINSRELFLPSEAPKKRGILSLLAEKLRRLYKRIAKRRTKPQLISSATLFGALCASLLLAVTSAAIVLSALFFRYDGKYSEISVPDLTSMQLEKAISTSNDIFEYTVIYEENPSKAAGSVISQSPLPNVVRKIYGRNEKINITLTVSKESETIVLPRLVGTQLRDSSLLLKNFGINVQVIEQYSDTIPYGTIFFSSLPQGSKLSPGDKIALKASKGKQTRYLQAPDLWGLSEYEATALLKSKNLSVGDIKYENSILPIGTVIYQDIAPDTTIAESTKISFTLSGGIYY